MEFTYIADGIDAVVIDNFYTEKQLKEIMIELKWLTKSSVMVGPDKLASAENEHGSLASKKGIFLENVFKNWKHSALISHGITQSESKIFTDKLLEFNTLFKAASACNQRSHLLSYYENSDFYKPHTDTTFFTMLNYFFVEPKQFEGGEIVLYSATSNKQATIDIKQNRTVLIASCTWHEVNAIKSDLNNTLSGFGRYCNAIFLKTKDRPDDSN